MNKSYPLGKLLQHIGLTAPREVAEMQVEGVSFLPAEITPQTLAVGIRDWHGDYHDKVLQSPARLLILDRPAEAGEKIIFQVENAAIALSRLAAEFAGRPADQFPVIGITGTNGKTTITTQIESALTTRGWKIGRMGTLGATIAGQTVPLTRTTPNPPELYALFGQMADQGCNLAVMEVGSFGLRAHRVDDVGFHTGVFTNLTRDHLDVHGTMEVYAAAKARLFECLRPEGGFPRALLCADNPWWPQMNPPADRWTYGFDSKADLRLSDARLSLQQSSAWLNTPLGSARIQCHLPGKYNLQNTTAAIGILLTLGFALEEAISLIETAALPPGRTEFIPNDRGLNLVVDYAHNPDGLASVLQTLRPHTPGKLWVLFGCGGFRDQGKRAQMGESADTFADQVVLTSDNSRNESPRDIIRAIQTGMRRPPAHIDYDRAAAIAWVLGQAREGDTILFAGMGHERSQIMGDQEVHFNELQIIQKILKQLYDNSECT
ncbi:MAG: UDP-N-acetylmuramoyl-L-alanyl-D-glutamate--2,6-diaminopimelate ligase [Bacteroidia bacterium]|nr:UDP-N-acetylmuramoyl-L-alanyl-D-glutamate--2,6-diaminopimelate ligase [Bacteroidia bacterium]